MQTAVYIVKVRLFKLNLLYRKNRPGCREVRLMVGSRNWLRPGEFLWRISVRRFHATTGKECAYRVWRSVWRRPVPALDKPPVYGAWQVVPRRKRKK